MPKATTRKITTAPATKPATVAVAKQANAARVAAATVPAPAASPVTPVAPSVASTTLATIAAATVATVAKPSGSITRTAATIAAQRTNFNSISDRDTAYLAFFTKLANRNGGTCTAQQIAQAVLSGETPHYAGSCKPNDAGVRVRLHKAGRIVNSADGLSFTIAPVAVTVAAAVAPKA